LHNGPNHQLADFDGHQMRTVIMRE
jgi:hypothetical protein